MEGGSAPAEATAAPEKPGESEDLVKEGSWSLVAGRWHPGAGGGAQQPEGVDLALVGVEDPDGLQLE